MTIKNFSRKHGLFTLLLVATLALLVFPDAKAWLLRQMLRTGFFDAEANAAPAGQPVGFAYRDGRGNRYSITDLKGKVVLVNFWASWCPPCRAELPSLQRLQERFKNDTTIVFVMINEDDKVEVARRFAEAHHLTLSLYQRLPGMPDSLYSGTLPTTLLLDKNGRLRYRHEGMVNFDADNFAGQLRKLAAE